MAWLSRQFSTRVIVLIPIAIAINIVLGYTVQTILKLPIYLDSIGTILVGVLAGPIAGALTGILSNLIWQYAPGIGGGTTGPFAITAGVIGLLAGIWGQLAVYKSRPASGTQLLLAALAAAVIVVVVAIPILNNPAYTDPNIGGYPSWVYTAAVVIAAIVAVVVAGFIYIRRDLGAPRRRSPRLRPARPDRAIPRAEPAHEVRDRHRERGRRVRGSGVDGAAQRPRADRRDRGGGGRVALSPAVR